MTFRHLGHLRYAAPIAAALLAGPAFAQSTDTNTNPATSSSGTETSTQNSVSLPLSQDVRRTSTEALQQVTYDLIALQHNVHQAHWNVQGIEFYQLHEFYGELYSALLPFIDQAAERKLALGEAADGRLVPTAENTTIQPIDEGYLNDRQTLELLEANYATMSSDLYSAIDATEDDLVTQDLLIGFSHVIDKHFWQLRAHLERGR
ncbi:Dps family protein [Fulvimarina endophytica]|nr:DNA starvation/stationary phase protection protein [Fulvimarina endophytica]